MLEYIKQHFENYKEDYKRFNLLALSAGASLILGLLSFGGMYALWPVLFPAISSLALSVVYEFEIYSQNLSRAFDKLFTNNYFEKQLPKYYLKRCFEDKKKARKGSSFFKAYEKALRSNDTVTLDLLEEIFDEQLNAGTIYNLPNAKHTVSNEPYDASLKASLYSTHAASLHAFLHKQKDAQTPSIHEEYKRTAAWRHSITIPALKIFAFITTLSMSLGTSYLLVEFFSLVPWLAAVPAVLPIIIVPLSLLGGVAYGLLTFNAITNLIANDTFSAWIEKIRKGGWTLSNLSMGATASTLFILALTLTICTAGTWWTIAHQIRPLFGWMRRMPSFIMGVINPIVMWFSNFAFNIENTSGTLNELFQEQDKDDPTFSTPSVWEQIKHIYNKTIKYRWENENVLQWINPFRPLLLITLSLRYVFFIGHLFSIGVTADRIPKLSQYLSSVLGGLSEGFEDWDYFFGEHTHSKELHALLHERLGESQGHNHDTDIPTRVVNFLAEYLYDFASRWDTYSSKFSHDKMHTTYEASNARLREAYLKPSIQTYDFCKTQKRPKTSHENKYTPRLFTEHNTPDTSEKKIPSRNSSFTEHQPNPMEKDSGNSEHLTHSVGS